MQTLVLSLFVIANLQLILALPKITTPSLILDKDKCLANIRRMAQKANEAGIKLRPHCKTHASLEVARWMRDVGNIHAITVSSFSMAEYFSEEWDDITVAFPVNILEIERVNRIASKVKNLNILVEGIETVDFLEDELHNKVSVWIKVDTGYGRTGIPAEDFDRLGPVLARLKNSSKMDFQGFLAHSGHTYGCSTKEEVKAIHRKTRHLLLQLKEKYSDEFPDMKLSFGDTPSCSILDPIEFEGLDEMRPGNFVFYDLEQASIGCCRYEDIAVAVACPIVAKHPQRSEIIVYGGGVHFSKDRMTDKNSPLGEKIIIFGKAVDRNPTSFHWEDEVDGMYLKSISQEHGKVSVPAEVWDRYSIGDLLFILPVHSCMTADILKHKGYITIGGDKISRMTN